MAEAVRRAAARSDLSEVSNQQGITTAEERSFTDHRLMSLIAAGDVDAFRVLFRRHAPHALSVARAVTRRADLAENAVQDAFTAVWREPSRYRKSLGSVRTWLMRTVHHRSVDLVRREESQHRRVLEALLAVQTQPPSEDPADLVVERIALEERSVEVHRRLRELPPEQARVIELMYFGGLTQVQISQLLSIPLGTVKSRTLLGMRRLRDPIRGSAEARFGE